MSKIEAYKLRNKHELSSVPNDKPGYYKWWAPKDKLLIILDKLDIPFDEVQPWLEKEDRMYCVYVGVAIKESIQDRLDWHVNQKNKPSNVISGTLSTLRRTISSLVGESMLDTGATNKFIDSLVIEFHPVDLPIKSPEAKAQISKIEHSLLSGEYFYPLNIQENRHQLTETYQTRSKLIGLRKIAKEKAKQIIENQENDEKI